MKLGIGRLLAAVVYYLNRMKTKHKRLPWSAFNHLPVTLILKLDRCRRIFLKTFDLYPVFKSNADVYVYIVARLVLYSDCSVTLLAEILGRICRFGQHVSIYNIVIAMCCFLCQKTRKKRILTPRNVNIRFYSHRNKSNDKRAFLTTVR